MISPLEKVYPFLGGIFIKIYKKYKKITQNRGKYL